MSSTNKDDLTRDQAKAKKILEDLLTLPENQECADCRGKKPRWASTNLGIFVCIRCSGIHRNLGVHISKVKSVNLDKWSLELAEGMREKGNKRQNELYEATLPPSRKVREADDTYKVENFIRDKYERKLWYKEPEADDEERGDGGDGGEEEEESGGSGHRKSSHKDHKKKSSSSKKAPKKVVSDDEADFDEHFHESSKTHSAKPKATSATTSPQASTSHHKKSTKKTTHHEPAVDILSGDFSQVSFGDAKAVDHDFDAFGEFTSGDHESPAKPHQQQHGHKQQHQQQHQQHQQQQQQQHGHKDEFVDFFNDQSASSSSSSKKDSTASIMALFSNTNPAAAPPSMFPPNPAMPYGAYGAPPPMYPPAYPAMYPPAPAYGMPQPYGMYPSPVPAPVPYGGAHFSDANPLPSPNHIASVKPHAAPAKKDVFDNLFN